MLEVYTLLVPQFASGCILVLFFVKWKKLVPQFVPGCSLVQINENRANLSQIQPRGSCTGWVFRILVQESIRPFHVAASVSSYKIPLASLLRRAEQKTASIESSGAVGERRQRGGEVVHAEDSGSIRPAMHYHDRGEDPPQYGTDYSSPQSPPLLSSLVAVPVVHA